MMLLNFKFSSILNLLLVLGLASCMGQFSGSQGGSGGEKSNPSNAPASQRSLSSILKDLEKATAGNCNQDTDCVGEGYKKLPCGQFSDTYFYSNFQKSSEDIDHINALFDEFDLAFQAQQSGMFSTCEAYIPIIPICSNEGKCEAPPPAP